MSLVAVLLLALALSADAMSVGAVIGMRHHRKWQILRVSCCFGLFQALLPLAGATAGDVLLSRVAAVRPWVVLAVLGTLGVRMIMGGDDKGNLHEKRDPTAGWALLVLSVAVSIDALAAGVSLSHAQPGIWLSAGLIGLTTTLLTAASMTLATRFPKHVMRRGEVLGGVVLVGLGVSAFL